MNANLRLCFQYFARLVALFTFCSITLARAQSAKPAKPTPDKLWRLIASSGLIVEGTLLVPQSDGKPVFKKIDQPGYVLLELTNVIVLKGTNSDSTISFNQYAKDISQRIPPAVLTASQSQRVIAFLVPCDDIVALSLPSPWFLHHQTNSFAISEPELIERIKRELAEQNRMLGQFARSEFGKPDDYDTQVKQLVEKFFTAERTTAFRELEKLGWPAVPAMIRRLDDRRGLAGVISLVNPPGHWEGIRHYGVDNVTQALDAILEQVTHMSFGHCYNSHSRAESISRDGWRIWLMYGFPDTPQSK